MTIEKERLLSLIEYAQQSARLRAKPPSTITQHNHFALYEHQLRDCPGVSLNIQKGEGEDEVWLLVKRLHETKPPEVTSAILKPWIAMTNAPDPEPKLKTITDGASLIAAGTHRSSTMRPVSDQQAKLPPIDPSVTISLDAYENQQAVKTHFQTYLENKWHPWASEERHRRWTIRLYSQLFTLKQQLEGGIVEAQLELAWGVGIGIWTQNGTVEYPLITRLVEINLDPKTAEIEIRPRDVDPKLELDWYVSVDNPGVAELERAAKDLFSKASTTFSPFDRGTFEPLLQAAATHLDPNGVYWPNQVPPADRSLPKPEEKLKVTDTWVLFARPRTNSIFIQDLENLKKKVSVVENSERFPPAVTALVTDPATDNQPNELPVFRGVSGSYQDYEGRISGNGKCRDLYFPKPFNNEQVRIVQLLEISDGVVVQGPPGTGKTHTIANVICHYLANGWRVLVTSMKDPALAVLHDHLPEEIQPLVISLLTSEQEGMKQFEFAIQKIASEVQSLDRYATARLISQLEETIDALHGKLARIDGAISEWARKNLECIKLDDAEIDPQDAAHEVVDAPGQYEWIPDRLGISPEFRPQISDADIIRLREARKTLGEDISYVGQSLPQLVEFPDSKLLLQVHQDLARYTNLSNEIESGQIPPLVDSNQETIHAAQQLLEQIEQLRDVRKEISNAGKPWTIAMQHHLRSGDTAELIAMLEALGTELGHADKERQDLLKRPVHTPANIETDAELVQAISNLAAGKSPFGVFGVFGKSHQKEVLQQITVLGSHPDKSNSDGWAHVRRYLANQKRLRELAVRWNALAAELHIERVPGVEPQDGVLAADQFELYCRIKRGVELERLILTTTTKLFPSWAKSRDLATNSEILEELDRTLRNHLTRIRLADVWTVKERFQRILDGKGGRIVDKIRDFVGKTLGNPDVPDPEIQADWSSLMAELSRILGLGPHLHDVTEICERVKSSGAPQFADALKQPLMHATDPLLPDNWRQAWRVRRLATYLESIDAEDELKKLAKVRTDLERDLSRAYQDIVIKRTWLKLAENASPSIRAALQAYLNAIQKIGKGTGKRAVRYRQDARNAAHQANPAVPCWVMPHYRVSESLPPELGCFDLVVVDEASQSDLAALPALLRAQKVLIVGDDKQVSPEGVGLEEDKVRSLMNRFLGNQVLTYRPQMSPERSIYDLYKVVFAKSGVMLKEHFRCVGPIIEYSKREFYNHELRPLRVPRASERLDPPLVDVVIENGYRRGDLNLLEAKFIVDEIIKLVSDPAFTNRTIGVVSLLGDKQAYHVWERLTEELGPEEMQRHKIACGDARTFQGKERHIMFMSMVSAPNDVGAPLSRDTFAQRFNVAASRAQDRMYLVRSLDLAHLSDADKLRRSLINHFALPYAQDETRVEDLRKLCESPFEREVYDELTQLGYYVTPQIRVGQYRIDLVVEGHNDSRLAVECDGDKYHGADKWADDMQRQRVLERAGWVFWRCFASSWTRRRKSILDDLLKTLEGQDIQPIGAEGAPCSVHSEQRRIQIDQ